MAVPISEIPEKLAMDAPVTEDIPEPIMEDVPEPISEEVPEPVSAAAA
jgi:hypothetical protein